MQTILIDEGFKVSCLYVADATEVRATVERLAPHCVLLDGGNPAAYGLSWDVAAWLAARPVPIPAVMLTAHTRDREEAVVNASERAKAAHMAGVIGKPFDIDRLVTAVHTAVGDKPPTTDRQEDADSRRLLAALRGAGAQDTEGSKTGRVWATSTWGLISTRSTAGERLARTSSASMALAASSCGLSGSSRHSRRSSRSANDRSRAAAFPRVPRPSADVRLGSLCSDRRRRLGRGACEHWRNIEGTPVETLRGRVRTLLAALTETKAENPASSG